jgi:nitrile hydratase subunit alpha
MSVEHESLPIAARVRRFEEAVIRAGLATDEELDGYIQRLLRRSNPANGARLVARAWVSDEFRRRLLSDAPEACRELGLPEQHGLTAVENTADVHNVVVCTLCSCYPVALLGPSPSWYKSAAYRARVVREPRPVLAEFGLEVDPGIEIRVWDASAETRYLVVPRRPEGTESLGEDELAGLVTRNGLIGTAAV